MNLKLFIRPHLKSILAEIEKELNVKDIDEVFNEIFNQRVVEEENARKQVIESFEYYDSLKNTHLKYNTLLNFILDERKALNRSSNSLLGKLCIRFLNQEISEDEFKKYLIFSIYDKAFANNFKKSFDVIGKEFSNLLLPFYKYKFYVTTINSLLSSNNPGISDSLIDIETSLSSKFITQLQVIINENNSLVQQKKQVLNEIKNLEKKNIDLEKNRINLEYDFEKQKSKCESLESDKRHLEIEIESLKKQVNYLEVTEEQLYEDYIFGDYLMIYEKIYKILKDYKSFEEPFSVFCYCLQKHKTSRVIKRGLTTNKYLTLNILGYMFNCLFKFSISKKILSKQFDLISFLEPRFFIIDSRKQEKPLPERYLKDIIKETSLTPDEIIVKDKIDSIFDQLL